MGLEPSSAVLTRNLPLQTRDLSRGVSVTEGGVAFGIAVVVPLALCAVGAGGPLRILFPAATSVAAAILFHRQSPWYASMCLWLFCSTPLIRRLIDAQVGWDPANPVLLAPYLACAFAALSAFRLLADMPHSSRYAFPFLVILGCIAYGFVLAVLGDRAASGLVDAMKWSSGPLIALHVLQRRDLRDGHRKVLTLSLMVAVPMMALYGIAQFVGPAYWDVDWMNNVKSLGLDSIGTPRPFDVRVFSTMNSPGSLGAMLAFGILVSVQTRLLFMLPVAVLSVVALMLTQYRSVWAATIIGVLYLIASDRKRLRVSVAGIGATSVVALCLVGTIPQMGDVVMERFQTLTALNADESGADRLDQYVQFVSGDANSSDNPVVGMGLASFGAFRVLDKHSWSGTDSGLIETFSVFGIVVGSIFVGCLSRAILTVFQCEPTPDARLYRAVMITMVILIPFGSIFVGETGFCAWFMMGLAAAASQASEKRQLHSSTPSTRKRTVTL